MKKKAKPTDNGRPVIRQIPPKERLLHPTKQGNSLLWGWAWRERSSFIERDEEIREGILTYLSKGLEASSDFLL